MRFFDHVPAYPLDPVFGIITLFNEDPREDKANLSVGVFYDEHLYPRPFDSVKDAEKRVIEEKVEAEYLPTYGLEEYIQATGRLVLGDAFWEKNRLRIAATQALGGTGSLRLHGDFLKIEIGKTIYLPQPTWPNHNQIFDASGLKVKTYEYYERGIHGIPFEKLYAFFEKLSKGNVILLHASCHNPTGCDFSRDQWKALSRLFLKNRLIPFFDVAYQGLGNGLNEDVESVRMFAEDGHEMLISVTHSKSFGVYHHRVGAVIVLTGNADAAKRVQSSLRVIIRANYSNPPRHGAAIVAALLNDSALRKKWEKELAEKRKRIRKMQDLLAEALIVKSKKKDFRFLKGRIGLFAYSELKPNEVDKLMRNYGIYIPSSGRINVTRIKESKLEYITDAIVNVCEE